MREKFSVLISVYFKEKDIYLRQALQSVCNQTFFPDEVVLVKDGPLTKELDTVISEFISIYPIFKIVELSQNVGLGNALNRGLKECSFELVARMDSDDICKPERFEKQLAVFHQNPDLAIVGSWIDEFEDSTENVSSQRKVPELSVDIIKYAKSRSPFNHMTVMFKKSQIEEVGSYKHFYLFEDYYLWARMIHKGYKLYNIQESLIFVRFDSSTICKRGGWKYAISEIKFQRVLLNMNIIGICTFCKNISIRLFVRLMPNKMRNFFYKKILR